MLTVNKRPLAENDLIDIWIYGYEQWGIAQADHYIDGMESRSLSGLGLGNRSEGKSF